MPAPERTSILIDMRDDQSNTISIFIPVIFGVISTILAIASVLLAYLQLRQLHGWRAFNSTLEKKASGTASPFPEREKFEPILTNG